MGDQNGSLNFLLQVSKQAGFVDAYYGLKNCPRLLDKVLRELEVSRLEKSRSINPS